MEKMVMAFKYKFFERNIPKGETDKGLGLGLTPDWSAQGVFANFQCFWSLVELKLTPITDHNWLLIRILGNRYPAWQERFDASKLKEDPEMKEWLALRKDFATEDHYKKFRLSMDVLNKYPRD